MTSRTPEPQVDLCPLERNEEGGWIDGLRSTLAPDPRLPLWGQRWRLGLSPARHQRVRLVTLSWAVHTALT